MALLVYINPLFPTPSPQHRHAHTHTQITHMQIAHTCALAGLFLGRLPSSAELPADSGSDKGAPFESEIQKLMRT